MLRREQANIWRYHQSVGLGYFEYFQFCEDLGEYAAHDTGRRSPLCSALAEAAYMTSLERNRDIVVIASYTPLLGKLGRTQWNPDLIYFTNTRVISTINYYVQKMFSTNSGYIWLTNTVIGSTKSRNFAFS